MSKKLSDKFVELTQELEKLRNEAKEKEDKRPTKAVGGIPFKIGESYFIRTVTYHLTGRVKNVVGNFLVLEDAAWIAESDRFMQTINEGKLKEIEPVNVDTFINLGSITDAFVWLHPLPREQK